MNNQDFYSKVVLSLAHIYKKKLDEDRLDTARISEFHTQEIKPLFSYNVIKN